MVICKNGTIPDLTIYSYYDCCGILIEGTSVGSELICFDDNQPNSGVIDDGGTCSYSCVTPTPTITPTNTPTPTITPTVTPTQSVFEYKELGIDDTSSAVACSNFPQIGSPNIYGSKAFDDLIIGDILYFDSGLTNPVSAAFYSKAPVYVQTDASGVIIDTGSC